MARNELMGVVVPILTPLTSDEEVDTVSLRRLVNYLIEGGVDGIWAAGTSGEFASLTLDKHVLAIETVVQEVDGRVPVIGNISAPATQLTVNLGRAVREMGLYGVAATPPFYYQSAQDELLAHYRDIRERVGLPLWVYNIPATVKTVVEPPTVAQLAREGTVVGIKDSSGNGELFAQLNVLCQQGGLDLHRFLGTTYQIATVRAVGGHGVIPSIANLVPAPVSGAWQAGMVGDSDRARRYNEDILTATKVLRLARGGGPNAATLAGMKSALKLMGILDHDHVSLPLRALTVEERENIPPILEELGLATRVAVGRS